MKYLVIVFLILATAIKAQPPVLGTLTVIPQPASAASSLSVIVTATTNYGGNSYGKQFYVYGNTVHLKICYFQNMLTVIQSHRDTFNIGILPSGTYTVILHARISTSSSNCYPGVDSALTNTTFQVQLGTAFSENKSQEIGIFPNPVTDQINVSGISNGFSFRLYSADGSLKSFGKALSNEIDLSSLTTGYYFVEIETPELLVRKKVVKVE